MPWGVAIGAVVSVGTAAYSASQQSAAGQATGESDAYKAAVARNNATLANEQSSYAIQSGNQSSQLAELKTSAELGALKTSQAASGFQVNSGSNVNVRAGVAGAGAEDALTIRMNAARTAYQYQVDASNDTAQGTLDSMAAESAVAAGDANANSTLIQGATSLASSAGKVANNWDNLFGSSSTDQMITPSSTDAQTENWFVTGSTGD